MPGSTTTGLPVSRSAGGCCTRWGRCWSRRSRTPRCAAASPQVGNAPGSRCGQDSIRAARGRLAAPSPAGPATHDRRGTATRASTGCDTRWTPRCSASGGRTVSLGRSLPDSASVIGCGRKAGCATTHHRATTVDRVSTAGHTATVGPTRRAGPIPTVGCVTTANRAGTPPCVPRSSPDQQPPTSATTSPRCSRRSARAGISNCG